MLNHINDKSLVPINQKSIFYKIKMFFSKLLKRKENIEIESQIKNIETNDNNKSKDVFMNNIKNIENDETRLLNLQKKFDNYEIDKNQLSEEQISKLIVLYKKQIDDLKKSNEKRKEKLLLYRKNAKVSRKNI